MYRYNPLQVEPFSSTKQLTLLVFAPQAARSALQIAHAQNANKVSAFPPMPNSVYNAQETAAAV